MGVHALKMVGCECLGIVQARISMRTPAITHSPTTPVHKTQTTAYLERWAKAAGKFKEKQQASGVSGAAAKVRTHVFVSVSL